MKKPTVKVEFLDDPSQNSQVNSNSRRRFIKLGGLAMAGSAVLYGCSDDTFDPAHMDKTPPPVTPPEQTVFDLGSGDLGILNYAYALEQLEAAFYVKVLAGAYFDSAPANEKEIFTDLRNHEEIHRAFFSTAIGAAVGDNTDAKLPDLEFDLSAVDFDSRDSVLQYAQILEDTGVAAYNGAGDLISDAGYLLIAGKIVSVEARHASAIRNLIQPGTANFAADDVLVDLGGSGVAYDKATPPADILAAVGDTGFITTEFTADNLPSA